MEQKYPWECHPDLEKDGIISIARLIAEAYHEALEYRNEPKGDTRWAHGVRRYEWMRRRILDEMEAERLPFVKILNDRGQRFEIQLGQVPLKIKRTFIESPDRSTLAQSQTEEKQLSLLDFAGLDHPCRLRWRFIVEDDLEGDVLRIAFVGLSSSGIAESFWEIPKDEINKRHTRAETPDGAEKKEGTELPSATVSIKEKTSEKKEKKV